VRLTWEVNDRCLATPRPFVPRRRRVGPAAGVRRLRAGGPALRGDDEVEVDAVPGRAGGATPLG